MASLSFTTIALSSAAVNLSSPTRTDWAHWGDTANSIAPSNRKSGGGSLIGAAMRGGASALQFGDSPRTISWSDGTPSGSGSNANGEYTSTNAAGDGFTLTFPLGNGSNSIEIYGGVFISTATIVATVSDGSSSPISNTTTWTNLSGPQAAYCVIECTPGGAGQTLTVEIYHNVTTGNVTLSGAAITQPSGSTNTPLNPAQKAIALSSPAPTLTQTANQSVSPAVKSASITGFAPTLAQTANQAVAPGGDSVAVTGFAPTIAQTAGATFIPAAASLAMSGPLPTLAQTANQSVSPVVDSVAITGFAPSIVQASASVALNPAPALLAIVGPAPTFTQTGQDPYPLGSGGAPLEYYPSAFEIRDQARRERLDAWAREEQAITRRLQRKPRKPTLQPLDLPRPTFGERSEPAETPTPIASPKVAAIAKAVQARRQAESPEAKAEKLRLAQAEADEQARKTEEERKTIERRARNRRRAMELAARFFFS